jgi:hypothetical protein
MSRYDHHKNPFTYRLNQWAQKRITEHLEQMAKNMPAHVQKMEKDFMHMAFENKNSIFTMPVVKMPQQFSRFGREPTQEKDMGMAVPSGYYMGGVSAFSGGRTNFYPRGNLSSLSFQPVSNLQSPNRDYDQHWECGGPNGWRCKVMEKQSLMDSLTGGSGAGNAGGGAGTGGASTAASSRSRQIMAQTHPIQFASSGTTNGSSSGGQQQQQQQDDFTEFSFDKDGQAIMQSKDKKHYLKVNQKDKKVMLTGEGDSTVFGKSNAYLNSGGGMCVLNPNGESEESGAGWDSSQKGIGKGAGSSSGGNGVSSPTVMAVNGHAMTSPIPMAGPAIESRASVNPLDSGGGGGGGGGGKVYLGGDPKKDKFCLVQTICGPSKNVYAKIG